MGDEWPYGPPKYASFADCRAYLATQGMDAASALIGAAIGTAESSRDLTVINDTPATGDYSVGVWQINYYGSLRAGRTAAFGTPKQLIDGGIAKQSYACYEVWVDAGASFTPWSTYNSGAYLAYLGGGGGGTGSQSEPEISEGSTGAAVTLLQTDLNVLGYGLAVDGVFGAATYAAVIKFQRSQGLSQDGVVGPETWAALEAAVQEYTGGTPSGGTPSGPAPPVQAPAGVDSGVLSAWSNLTEQAGPVTNGYLQDINTLTHSSPAR